MNARSVLGRPDLLAVAMGRGLVEALLILGLARSIDGGVFAPWLLPTLASWALFVQFWAKKSRKLPGRVRQDLEDHWLHLIDLAQSTRPQATAYEMACRALEGVRNEYARVQSLGQVIGWLSLGAPAMAVGFLGPFDTAGDLWGLSLFGLFVGGRLLRNLHVATLLMINTPREVGPARQHPVGWSPLLPLDLSVVVEGEGVDLLIGPEEALEIVGPSGSGQRTLIRMLTGEQAPELGSISSPDGLSGDSHRVALRQRVGRVEFETKLEGTTIAEEIAGRRGQPTSPASIERAIRLAGLDRVLETMPMGQATRIGPAGAWLSTTERVRLILAREIAASPDLLVLGEVLESFDEASKGKILTDLRNARIPWIHMTRRETGCASNVMSIGASTKLQKACPQS